MKTYVETSVSHDFNLSIDVVAEKCKNDGRFKAWLNSDVTRIKEVLNKVKSNGVSPSFFASYERSEGYNPSWGWLNHTRINGNPLQDADSVSKWVVSQSNNMSDTPSWYDSGNPVHFVPPRIQQEGNIHFSSLPKGTIGRVVISGTAAATWEVYYPNGLLKEYNQIKNYGAPLNNMIITIQKWGGSVVGGSGGVPTFPTKEGLPITSKYGWRIHPITGDRIFHFGTDIGGGGTSPPIYATQSGKVTRSEFTSWGGWMVDIEHTGDSYHSRYQHMAIAPHVNVGDTVTKGQQIGIMGRTGDSTGIHLHFEIATSGGGFGGRTETIDPEIYLNMSFDGGSEDSGTSNEHTHIKLLLCDALNGWKY